MKATGPVLIALALAGCAADRPLSRPDGATPVDVIALRDTLTAADPDAEAFSVLSGGGQGVIIRVDGVATFMGPSGPVETTVSGFDGNTMCLAEAGRWPGLCISLFRTPDGGNFCEGTFGDGRAFDYICTISRFDGA